MLCMYKKFFQNVHENETQIIIVHFKKPTNDKRDTLIY